MEPYVTSVPRELDKILKCLADFSHDHARSRAYRWGEDGIAGVTDTHGQQCIAFAFWNEKEYVRSGDCNCNLADYVQ